MALLEVKCPGCQAGLKAPESMVGKKAKCKRCGTSFRIPGPASDSVSEQMLSSIDSPGLPPASGPSKKTPAPEPLSLEDAEEEPVAVADPFSFSPEEEAPPPPRIRGTSKGRTQPKKEAEEDEEKSVPKYRRERKKSGGKLILVAGVFGLLAIGVGIAAFLMNKNRNEAELAKKAEAKKSEPPVEVVAPKDEKSERESKTEKAPRDIGKKPPIKRPKGREPVPTTGPVKSVGGVTILSLSPKTKSFQFVPIGEKPEPAMGAELKFPVEVSQAALRRVFPPSDSLIDAAILWQSAPGFMGKGEKLVLDRYSTTTKTRADRLELEGDGKPAPICDLSADADTFAIVVDGKVTIYKITDKTKALEGFDPYADKPEQKKAGLAAIYLVSSAPMIKVPDRFVTVSTAGAIHLWDFSKKMLKEFIAPKGEPQKVVAGKTVAISSDRLLVALLVAGVIYQVPVRVDVEIAPITVGEVGKALAIAPGGKGAVLFVFETTGEVKQQKGVMLILPDEKSIFYLWPEAIGEAVRAGWVSDQISIATTSTGASILFDYDEGHFQPVILLQTATDAITTTVENTQSILVPTAGDAAKATYLGFKLPMDDYFDLRGGIDGKTRLGTLPTWKLEGMGFVKSKGK